MWTGYRDPFEVLWHGAGGVCNVCAENRIFVRCLGIWQPVSIVSAVVYCITDNNVYILCSCWSVIISQMLLSSTCWRLVFCLVQSLSRLLPSNRHHRSNGDCLEGKRENYQVCSVQYCVQQLCTVQCTHMNGPNSSLNWVLSHWAHFTVLRFIFVYVLYACVGL